MIITELILVIEIYMKFIIPALKINVMLSSNKKSNKPLLFPLEELLILLILRYRY